MIGRKYGLLPTLFWLIPSIGYATEAPKAPANSAHEAGGHGSGQNATGASSTQPAVAIDPKKVAEAAQRFERALKLFDTGDNAGALAEFKKIYDMVPQPVVLYNIGLVFAVMSRPVDAADALERAIAAGGLAPDQLERAKRTLAEQQARIGRITISCNPEPARIEIDGVEVAQGHLTAPIRVSEGSHIVGAAAEGYATARKEVLVAGNADATVQFELTRTQSKQMGNITVRSRVTAADVIVDGKPVGKTPLSTSITVAPGHHVVELRRSGYAAAKQEIDVGPGGLGDLSIDPKIDGTALPTQGASMALDPTESPVELVVDGERFGQYSVPLRLPVGPHHITVTSPGFLPLDRDVVLDPMQSNVVRVQLEPTVETRRNYKSNAMMHRTWGWVSIIGGAAIAGGSTALAIVESSRRSDGQSELNAINAKNIDGTQPPCDWRGGFLAENADNGAACNAAIGSAANKISDAKTGRTVAYVGIGVGVAAIATGVILLVTGGPPDKYENRAGAKFERKPSFAVIPGPGQVGSALQISF